MHTIHNKHDFLTILTATISDLRHDVLIVDEFCFCWLLCVCVSMCMCCRPLQLYMVPMSTFLIIMITLPKITPMLLSCGKKPRGLSTQNVRQVLFIVSTSMQFVGDFAVHAGGMWFSNRDVKID